VRVCSYNDLVEFLMVVIGKGALATRVRSVTTQFTWR
jgi:hypothetical protein